MELTHEKLLSLLHYNPDTGEFRWRVNVSNVKAGATAGSARGNGYVGIRIAGKGYYAHRLAIFYQTGEWPSSYVDHRNMDKGDNRFENLREADPSQNKMNTRAQANNLLGVKGVSFDRRVGKYQARIKIGDRQRTIGLYETASAASLAYQRAAKDGFLDFARAA